MPLSLAPQRAQDLSPLPPRAAPSVDDLPPFSDDDAPNTTYNSRFTDIKLLMHPPPSPTRNNPISPGGRGPTPSARSSTSALSPSTATAPGNVVSAALRGATLAFNNNNHSNNNNQKKLIATAAEPVAGNNGNGNSAARSPVRGGGGTSPQPQSQVQQSRNINTNTNLAHHQGPGGGKPGPSPLPTQGTGLRGENGALLAATQAARGARPKLVAAGELGGLSRQVTGGHGHERVGGGVETQRLTELSGRAETPSLIAATLAASRSVSPVRPPVEVVSAGTAIGKGQSVRAGVARTPDADAPDTASIPPTTSLVSLFEGKRNEVDVDPVKKQGQSFVLDRPVGDGPRSVERDEQERQRAKPKPKPKPKLKLSADLGGPGMPVESTESFQNVSQKGATRREGLEDTGIRPKVNLPPPRQVQSEKGSQQPTTEPNPYTGRRPLTPPSPLAARDPSTNVISPRPKKLVRTPRLKPPVPPTRTSSIAKMDEPIIQITPVEPESDQLDVLHRHSEHTPRTRRLSRSSVSSDDTFVSASSVPSQPVSPVREAGKSPRLSQPQHLPRGTSIRSLSTPDLQRPPALHVSTNPNLNLTSLANAIVASNLASARLSTPSSPAPPPVPAPRRPGRSPLQPQRTADSILTQLTGGGKSPIRLTPQRTGMLQTLRSPQPSLSDDEDARHRRRRARDHHHHRRKVLPGGSRKHAHHEGARRRWRDEITSRERRRYEAVWASNRGLFLKPGWGLRQEDLVLPPPRRGPGQEGNDAAAEAQARMLDRGRAVEGPEAEVVANVVVRDIWCRSRLPADELAEVWDLVDRGRRGALGREEFVVGLWLIDQRLKGRKIPARVGVSVWESVAGGVVPLPSPSGGKRR